MTKTKEWHTRAFYILIALALVASTWLVGVMPRSSATRVGADPAAGELIVYIERPAKDASFDVGDEFYVNAVVGYKDIEEKGSASVDASVTINTGANAELVYGETATKSVTINRNCVADVWWKVRCSGEGSTTITVTATAGALSNYYTVTIYQGTPPPPCKLDIDIIEPESTLYVDPCDDFVVKATFKNEAGFTIENVVAYIDIEGPASLTAGNRATIALGDILSGDTQEVAWNLHCDGVGTVYITVGATADNLSDDEICQGRVTVKQGEEPSPPQACFSVIVNAPEEVCTTGCGYNSYQVKAIITNNCDDTCSNVTATISKTAGSQYATIEPPLTQSVGDIDPGKSKTVTWNVTCTGIGSVTFRVDAAGAESGCSASDTATTQQKRVLIDLIEPESYQTVHHNICQDFNVTANITNCDCFGMQNVTVQLDLPDSVCITNNTSIQITQYDKFTNQTYEWTINPNDLADPEKIPFPSFCACCVYTIKWINLHCCKSTPNLGQTAEEVYVKVWDGSTLVDQDYFRVMQTEKAHLAAGVEVYLGSDEAPWPTTPIDAVAVDQDFIIVVPVMNLGEATAENVSVTVNITGDTNCTAPHEFNLGDIPGREAKKAFLSCQCSGEDDLTITITDLSGTDAVTGKDIPAANLFRCGSKQIKQIPIEIEIIQPEDGEEFNCSDIFAVKAKITNSSTDEDNDLEDVTATINWSGPGGAELLPDQQRTISLGDVEHRKWAEAGWNFHCTSMGDVTFTVTFASANPLWRGSKSVTISQEAIAKLEVERLSPSWRWPSYYATGEEFVVSAEVCNYGPQPAENVVASVSYNVDVVEVVSESEVDLGTIDPGECKFVSFTMRGIAAGTGCGPEDADIEIVAEAPCAESDSSGMGRIYIYPAAKLVAEIVSAPRTVEVGDEFTVTARVTNVGWADASQVKLTIDTGANAALGVGESPVKTVGTLVGHGQNGTALVTWTLQCEGPGKSTITVTPSGNDECGGHTQKVCGYYYGLDGEPYPGSGCWYEYFADPGAPVRFIEPASTTVEQVEPAQLVMDITFPGNGYDARVGEGFPVAGFVQNIGGVTAQNVVATLSVDANASITTPSVSLGNIDPGQRAIAMWYVQCTGEGFSVFTATADADNAAPAIDMVTVKQGEPRKAQLVVEIQSPKNGDQITEGEDFPVTARITNIGSVTASGVNVSIDPGDNASVVSGPSGTWPISLGVNDQVIASWMLSCDNAGFSVIVVSASGTNSNTARDSVTVKQVPSPQPFLTVSVSAPAQIYEGATYFVTAVVTNTGGGDATDVAATISISGAASTAEPLTQTIGDISAGSSAVVDWAVSCTGQGGVNIAVTASGTGTNTAAASVAVQQTIDPEAWIQYLRSISATLVEIRDGLAVINTTLGQIKVSLDSINATLVEIKDGLATINTTLGQIKVSLDAINATLVSIEGDLVTIHTDLGDITVAIDEILGTTPLVFVTSPNGGEAYVVDGSSVTIPITWVARDDVTPQGSLLITLKYSSDNGASWTTIASSVANSGVYAWLAPAINSDRCLVKVEARDADGNVGFDTSNAVFSVTTCVDSPAIGVGLASIADKLVLAYGFYPGEGVAGWTIYNPDWATTHPEWNTLTTLYKGRGYFIKVDSACTLVYCGQSYPLSAGWNLIGWQGA